MNPSLRLAFAVTFATATAAHAQLVFTGVPIFFGGPPTTAPGNIITQINPWIFTPVPGGFSLTGQVTVTVPAGTSSGTLLAWGANYQIDNTLTTPGLYMTTTALTGFITAPAGGAADGGSLDTYFNDKSANVINPGSVSSIAFGYTAGASTTNYPPPGPVTSGNFFYTPVVGNFDFLEQSYFASYSYSGATPGVYTLDFPATSTASPTPEPTAALLLAFGGPLLLGLRRRPQSQG